jgi:class 3 adenylate cyclase
VSPGESGASIDEMLDRAVRAINHGDHATANALAGQVLAADHGNPEAEDLLATVDKHGEYRRLTLMFVDLVGSTVLSTRVEPETYRTLVGRYRGEVVRLVNYYEGHISSTKGDGLLALFGHPKAHEDDARRAVAAGLDITHAVARLSEQAERRFGVALNVRVGVHRGLVCLDTALDDVFGFAVNLAERIQSLAEPGTVAVSDAAAVLVGNAFELAACPPAPVKGVDGLVTHHRVLAERPQPPPLRPSPLIGRDRERTWLEETWQQARDGACTCPGVAFRGEPGIGKTRLARAAAELVEESGGPVIELRGSPMHTETGLHPVRRLLERRCGITRFTDGAERLRLLEAELRSHALDPATTVPLLAPVLGVGPEHGYQPAAVEGRTLYELIGAAAHRYVLACLDNDAGLVIAEDVHWFDPSTMELLWLTVSKSANLAQTRQVSQRQHVALHSKADDHTGGNGADVGVVPKLLASMHIRDVHLDQRCPQLCTGVSQRDRRVGERSGVENHRLGRVGGGVDPAEQLGLAVGLAHNGFQGEFGGFAFDERDQIVMGGAAVDLGLAVAEPAEVRAVDHLNG